jgi:uncharacterized membrane protein
MMSYDRSHSCWITGSLLILTIALVSGAFASSKSQQAGGSWTQGFDFRYTADFVGDTPDSTYVLETTAYPTTRNGITFGWVQNSYAAYRAIHPMDRSTQVDPRLAGVSWVHNDSDAPASFNVDLPGPGTYNIALAMGDEGYSTCWTQCEIQFLDGSNVLATVTGGFIRAGYFYDANGTNLSAAAWPTSNAPLQVTLAGTKLTMLMGSNTNNRDNTAIAHLSVTQVSTSTSGDYTLSASPTALSVVQGSTGTATITTAVVGGFSSPISLSATGAPAGTTVSFNQSSIAAPGAASTTMIINVGGNVAAGSYPITVTGAGGGVTHTGTVMVTVSATEITDFTVVASPVLMSVAQGASGTATITTAVTHGFSNAINLSTTGTPAGATVSFGSSQIAAPGAGSSSMTIAVGSSMASGTYPFTVTGAGGGVIHTTTVTLTVTPPPVTPPPVTPPIVGDAGNGITVADVSGSSQTNRPVTFGRYFKQGEISNYPQATVDSESVTVWQADVKNRWGDGSVKFAIVSLVIPSISSGGKVVVRFQNSVNRDSGGSGATPTSVLTAANMLVAGYNFDGQIQVTGPSKSPTFSARTILANGSTNCSTGVNCRYWLQGPVVTAVIIEDRSGRSFDSKTDALTGNPLHPIFEAWCYPQMSNCEVGMTLENAWASSTGTNSARHQTISTLTLTTGNSSPTTQLTIATPWTQYAWTRWRRAYWIGGAPAGIKFDYNPFYLLQTKAYPNYDTDYLPNATQLAAEYATYTNKSVARKTIPGIDDVSGDGGIVNIDENTDAAGEGTVGTWIGLFNTWDISYLLSGDTNLFTQMTDNADLIGRLPMFYREADTGAGSGGKFDYPTTGRVNTQGRVISINARQKIVTDWGQWAAGATSSSTNCGAPASDEINFSVNYTHPGGWKAMGTSHYPEFGFIPYTLTGKYYYMEQEEMAAAYALASRYGCTDSSTGSYFRQGELGLYVNGGVRDFGWYTRAVGYAAFLAPDSDPEQQYFKDKLLNNLAMQEGVHGIAQDVTTGVTNPADLTASWTFGRDRNENSQATSTPTGYQMSSPSPLGAWQNDSASASYAQNETYLANASLRDAQASFQENYVSMPLGMIRQMGIETVATKSLLTYMAIRPIHILLDPAVSPYFIGEYAFPQRLANGTWIPDWATWKTLYNAGAKATCYECPPGSAWYHAVQNMAALSFMADLTLKDGSGYTGQQAWNYFKNTMTSQQLFQTSQARWSIRPTTATLTVGAPPATNFTLTPSPGSMSVVQGASGTAAIATTVTPGFSSPISLSATGAPTGSTLSVSPAQIAAPGAGSSTMTINVDGGTAAGSYPIRVTGTGGGVTQTATVTLTVGASVATNFTLAASPGSLSVAQGASGTAAITTLVTGGFSSPTSLSARGAPAGTTVSFSLAQIATPGAGSSTMIINVGANTAAGSYPITVTGSGGGVTQTASVTLTVTAAAPANFTLSVSPSSVRVSQGASGTTTVSTPVTGGFGGSISLSATGAPAGATVSFGPSQIASPGADSSSMTITVGSGTALGTYPFTVTATGKGVMRTTTVTLTIQQPGGIPSGSGWHQIPNTQILSVCPPDDPNGQYADTTMTTTRDINFYGNCGSWFDSWSGAAVDDRNQLLILFGGGHNDSENNMVLTLNLSGSPTWQRFKDPTVPVPFPDSSNWEGFAPDFVRAADGGVYQPGASPSSRHTYGGLQYIPAQNKLFAFGGAVTHGGFSSHELWTLDMASGTWTLTSPYGRVPGGAPTTAYNPTNGHVVMHDNNFGLYDYNPSTNAYVTLTQSADISNTYHSAAIIDPVQNYFVVVSAGGGTAPANDYYPGTPTQQVVRAFDLSGADHFATHSWDDSSCNLIYAYSGLQWDSALGLIVGYPGGGNRIFFLNSGPADVVTAYGTVASHKCLNVSIGSQKGSDYPQDPEISNGVYFTGENQRFAYFPSLDLFVLVNRVSNNANVWILRLQ